MSWVCPKCERELVKVNQWHNCVQISVDSLFEKKPLELVLVFDKILSEVMDWPEVLVSTSQNCVVFMHRQTFLVIRPMKSQLDIKFFSVQKTEANFIFKSIPYSGKFSNHIRIENEEELIPPMLSLIRKSYELL